MSIRSQHYRANDYHAVAWKNGLGTTREITDSANSVSNADFIWRLSLPEITTSGAFSHFKGVDRLLLLIDGGGLELRCGQHDATLLNAPLDAVYFSGDDVTESYLHNGPVQVFNIMGAREKVRFSTSILTLGTAPLQHHPAANSTTLLYCLKGHCEVGYDDIFHQLSEQETLRIDTSSGAHRLVASAVSAVATIIKIDIIDITDR